MPDQAPEAVHDVALVDDQVRVLEAPLVIEVGLALSETVGAGVSSSSLPVVVLSASLAPPPQALSNNTQTEKQANG